MPLEAWSLLVVIVILEPEVIVLLVDNFDENTHEVEISLEIYFGHSDFRAAIMEIVNLVGEMVVAVTVIVLMVHMETGILGMHQVIENL